MKDTFSVTTLDISGTGDLDEIKMYKETHIYII